MLWMAVLFPCLPLEAASRVVGTDGAGGTLVVEQGRVCGMGEAAAATGVQVGMRLSTARGMAPDARVLERDDAQRAREQARLEEFACAAGHWTPNVCVTPPASVLLDVGGSVRLFGGVARILEGVLGCADERGLSAVIGTAVTPRAAEWLARAQVLAPPSNRLQAAACACALSREALGETLSPLPLAVLGVEGTTLDRLQAFGLRRVGEVLALPRVALAQRVGPGLVRDMAQALGEQADPRGHFAFPDVFRQQIELPGVLESADRLRGPARRLIDNLCGWLNARQAGATACTLSLLAERRGVPPVVMRLGLSGPSRDPARFDRLLVEKLAKTVLPAPIGELVLTAGDPETGGTDIVGLPGQTSGLFDAPPPQVPLDALLERLRARLGDAAVHGVARVADHRPECATRSAPPGLPESAPMASPLRPLWLLPSPEALPEIEGRPMRRGQVLTLLDGPERIESGWWDEGDIRRDYFFARTPAGEVFWIYRDATGWWAHGQEVALNCSPSLSG